MRVARSAVSMVTNSTSFLTLLWFASCTSLVTKHTKLVCVFLAFCGSFLVAAPVQTLLSLATTTATRPHNSKQALQRSKEFRVLEPSLHGTVLSTRTKNVVGFFACMISFFYLFQGNAIHRLPTTLDHADLFISNTYLAFSILTGYLIFDLWYTYLAPTRDHLWQIFENAATLTLLVVLLAMYDENISKFSSWMALWLFQRSVRHVNAIASVSSDSNHDGCDGTTANQSLSNLSALNGQQQQHEPLLNEIAEKQADHPSHVDTAQNLWVIHGQHYDLQRFVDRHPGGQEAILLGRGRDCTALVESYHPFCQVQVWKILEKYRVPTASGKIQSKQLQDPFYEVLCERVEAALREKGIDPIRDRGAPFFRVVYYVSVVMGALVSAHAHAKGSITGSFFLAIFGWLMGALGHDAGHFAVSQRFPLINDVGVWAMSLLCNPILWQHQHTYAHHSHTNEFDHDPDLHHFHSLLRVHWKFRAHSIHKYQVHWPFVMLAYALVVFGTCFWIPWGVIQSGSLYGIVEWTDRHRVWRSLSMILHTVCYVLFIIVLPFLTGKNVWKALLSVTTHVAVAGVIFAIFSQINHLNEPSLKADAENRRNRPSADRDPVITNSWAAAQVETSNNFCPDSFVWHLLSNGLNLQIEHHLFPGINHSHLHHIAPVVRQTCADFGVGYKSYDSWASLMCATLEWLKALSNECDVDLS